MSRHYPRFPANALVAAFGGCLVALPVASACAADPSGPDRARIQAQVDAARSQAEDTRQRALERAHEATERAREAARHAADHVHDMVSQNLHGDLLADLDIDLDFDLGDLPSMAFVSSEFGNTREIVKNAPYTAQVVNESVQILADGNRIVKKSTTLLARDTYGRTRQERQGPRGTTVYVFDPISGRNYVLNPQRKTAFRIPRAPAIPMPPMPPIPPAPPETSLAPVAPVPPLPPAPPQVADAAKSKGERVVVQRGRNGNEVRIVKDGTAGDDVRIQVIRVGRETTGTMPLLPPLPSVSFMPTGKGESKSLGTREIDGVKADGVQVTHTIAAGAIGNEKPIAIVSERWFSPELQLVVYAKTSDPRVGDTIYRLENLKRGEPAADLFKVPVDYKAGGERRG